MLAGEVALDGGAGAGHGAPTPDELLAHTLELEAYQREVEAQQRAAAKEQRRLERELRTLSVSPGPEAVPVPALEVTVMRVVGCDMLSNGLTGRDFAVVTHAGPGGWMDGQAVFEAGGQTSIAGQLLPFRSRLEPACSPRQRPCPQARARR